MTVSLMFYAIVFANLASTVETNNVVLNGFKADIDPVKQFMKVNRIEPILKSRITIFFDYLYIRQSGMTDDQILSELPKALRRGIANRSLGLLSGVPFFKPDMRPPEFLNSVVDTLYGRVYLPDQWLIKAQEAKREMLILREGEADIMHNGVQLAAVTVGDYFGDYHDTPNKKKSKKDAEKAKVPTVSMLDTDAGIVETKRLYRETIAAARTQVPSKPAAAWGAGNGGAAPAAPKSRASTTRSPRRSLRRSRSTAGAGISAADSAAVGAVVPLPNMDMGAGEDNAMLMDRAAASAS
ncbi:phosphorelay sensor kinase [Aureococcus anophagefferens]|nr:phosphorelay sensor kinase [Aureococcus anophagefferens]